MSWHDDATTASLVLRLTRQVTARHDLEDVLAETFRCLRPLVDFGGGSIQLLDDEGYVRMAAADPLPPAHVFAQKVPLGSSVAGRVILTEQPVYLPDLEAVDDRGKNRRAVADGVRAYFAAPLVADGHAVGLLQFDAAEPHAWTEADRQVFLLVAPIVASAIQNARSHARAAAARARAGVIERRLHEARALAAHARTCLDAADVDEAQRQLARLALLLGENPEGRRELHELPQQRQRAAVS